MRISSCCRRLPTALFVTTAIALSASSAGAGEATEAGARELVGTLETYLGSAAPGEAAIVTATPAGEGYAVEVDFDRLARPLRDFGIDLRAGRLKTLLVPAADGTWKQSLTAIGPIAVAFQGQTTQIRFEDMAAEGVFDPRLAAFTRHHTTANVVSNSARPAGDGAPMVDVEKKESGVVVDGVASASAGGGVDVAAHMASVKTVQTIRVSGDGSDGVPEMTFTIGFEGTGADAAVTGLRTLPLRDLWAHLVAHHGREDLTAGQSTLKARIQAALPIFDRMHYGFDAKTLSVETPLGFGGADRIDIGVDLSGLIRDGRFQSTMRLDGLAVHSMFVPAWVGRLIPTEIALAVKGSGYDLATPASVFLDTADFAAEKPLSEENGLKIGALFLPTGRMEFDFSGNRIASALYEVTVEGRLAVAATGATGALTVRATGLDAVEKLLADPKTGEEGQAALAGLRTATVLAERREGAHVWRIDVDGEAMAINGHPVKSGPPKKSPSL